MPTQYIERSSGGTSTADDSTTQARIKVNATSGVLSWSDAGTDHTALDTTSAQTLTAKTLTGNINADTKFSTTQFDAVSGTTGATLTNVVGLVQTVVAGTYLFRIHLAGIATANSGIKAGFKYTTTALTSLEATGRAYTASAVVVQHTTTATDQASLIASTTAAISVVVEGRMVVSTGGTVQLQAAQNASHADTTSVYVGSSMTFTRVS